MEPLTAVTVLAAKYGLQQLIGAIGGDPALGGLAAEVVGALWASESRLDKRLADIEGHLDEIRAQPHNHALGSGLRILKDASTAADSRAREHDLLRAREYFIEAGSSAPSTLQVALAERYLLLCGFALGRDDLARNALTHLQRAAVEAVLESARAFERASRTPSRKSADQKRAAAKEAADLAVQLIREADVLAQRFGRSAPQVLAPVGDRAPAQFSAWRVQVGHGKEVQFGPLRIEWRVANTAYLAGKPGAEPFGPRAQQLYADVEVHADPVLAIPATLRLSSPPTWLEWETSPTSSLGAVAGLPPKPEPRRLSRPDVLAAGQSSHRLRKQSIPYEPEIPAAGRGTTAGRFGFAALSAAAFAGLRDHQLVIGDVFIVEALPWLS